METSVDRIFYKYVEKLMDYALISKARSRNGLNLFMRIPGGAFLSSLILLVQDLYLRILDERLESLHIDDSAGLAIYCYFTPTIENIP